MKITDAQIREAVAPCKRCGKKLPPAPESEDSPGWFRFQDLLGERLANPGHCGWKCRERGDAEHQWAQRIAAKVAALPRKAPSQPPQYAWRPPEPALKCIGCGKHTGSSGLQHLRGYCSYDCVRAYMKHGDWEAARMRAVEVGDLQPREPWLWETKNLPTYQRREGNPDGIPWEDLNRWEKQPPSDGMIKALQRTGPPRSRKQETNRFWDVEPVESTDWIYRGKISRGPSTSNQEPS